MILLVLDSNPTLSDPQLCQNSENQGLYYANETKDHQINNLKNIYLEQSRQLLNSQFKSRTEDVINYQAKRYRTFIQKKGQLGHSDQNQHQNSDFHCDLPWIQFSLSIIQIKQFQIINMYQKTQRIMNRKDKQKKSTEKLINRQKIMFSRTSTKWKRSQTERSDFHNQQSISPVKKSTYLQNQSKIKQKLSAQSRLESINKDPEISKNGQKQKILNNDHKEKEGAGFKLLKSNRTTSLKQVIKYKQFSAPASQQNSPTKFFGKARINSQIFTIKKESIIVNEPSNIQRTKKKAKLLEKIPDHRRIRSSSKISEKILQIDHFFNKDDEDQDKVSDEKQKVNENTRKQQQQQALQHLLQIKLKTEPDRTTPIELHSFRQTGYSKITHITSISKYDIGLNIQKTKLSDILTKDELNSSKSLIKENEEKRKNHHLNPHPKQWQFHNCLSLQKIQLYSTNLKISCEGWVAIDYLELKYLRGWNPKAEDDFSPLIRLFIAKVCLGLGDYYGYKYNIDHIFVRVNDKHIYFDERQKLQEKGEKLKGIAPHTILTLRQLVTATVISNHQDLITHSVLALGFIIKKFHGSRYPSPRAQSNIQETVALDPLLQIKSQNQYLVFIKQTQPSVLQEYCEHFQQQCARICTSLDLTNTRVMVGFNCLYRNYWGQQKKNKINKGIYKINDYMVISSSLDSAVLFMKCMADHYFKRIFQHRIYEAEVKFQVGWNFWETRTLRWPNNQYIKYRLKGVGGKTNKGNECYVVWDQPRSLVISMADCKVNMHWKDTQRIQDWVEKHIPRFSKNYLLSATFYPTDTEKFRKIN